MTYFSKKIAIPSICGFSLWSMAALVFFSIGASASEQFVDLSASTNLETAQEILQEVIEEEGLIPGQPNHLSEMMERTGPALNKTKPVFRKAIVIPFCSSRHSWMLTEEDPRQLTLCPFSIGLYVLPTAPDTVHITYRTPGNDSTAQRSAELLLKKIATTTQLRLQSKRSAD